MLDAENKFWYPVRLHFSSGGPTYMSFSQESSHSATRPERQVSRWKKRTVETLGGYSLGISRNSAHRAEAIQFVQFLVRKQEQFMASTKPQRLAKSGAL